MKYRVVLVATFVLAANILFAQDEITDDELKKYAIAMDSIGDMKMSLLADISEMVKANTEMRNDRYNELSKIITDDAKLAEAKATPEEIAFIKEVAAKKAAGTAEITQTFQSLAKEYIGATSYNKVKKALTSDPEVKSRYQTFV
ncbi:MAG TPA: hypothetical protein PKU83_04745, partial [Chryseolinea sp.]|nr:hypothetical protein [Chryseolinea sp.]